jgi:predicted HD phosphohydrolase
LSGTNHGEIPAALLRPYISPKAHWLLSNHEVFQAYFYLDKCGGDKDLRDQVKAYKDMGIEKGHEWYDDCALFCERYDQPSFDPAYECDDIESFRQDVTEVLAKKPFWWETKTGEEQDCKARLANGYCMEDRK